MAEPKLVDYYAILNLPPRADLAGIENAYARISDELALRMDLDETSGAALRRVNEAYGVLSRPELRREYDKAFFSAERVRIEEAARKKARRREMAQRALFGALLVVVGAQFIALIYIGQGAILDTVEAAVAPLIPGSAG